MIPKRHGPSRRIAVRALGTCEHCKGEGITKGIFHEMACYACHGSGIVDRETGAAIELGELVLQLRMRLTRVNTENKALREQLERAGIVPGPAQDYAGKKNRRGIGGGHWTGD
ncbi:hypothetical protein [Pseudomonas boanensis]|uniref:hypothetical protein n=1 Tax=Metapseudomonas boanensis TaxID=2822138 RepID=UPI0035D4CE20